MTLLIHNLQKTVGETTLINIANLQIDSGQIVAVIGTANSGLHTLFQLIIGQVPATAGYIEFDGQIPTDKKFVSSLGVLFEEDTLYSHMSVEANLRFIAHLYHLERQAVDGVLATVGLNDQKSVPAGKLASGLKRRLALGRALLHDPQILILFDPFARCDENTIALITDLLKQQRERGKTILILSSNSDHLHFCDHRFSLQHGELNLIQPEETNVSQMPFRIPVRMDGKVTLINPVDVLYITVQDGQVILVTDREQFALQYSLTDLENRLSQSGFFRAHRAYLVNLQRVKDIISFTRDSFNLRLDDASETQIPLSKNAANQLKKIFDY